jgi:catechol 2,3-dioxygenase-like lactoylglutathione lyase family enzyme
MPAQTPPTRGIRHVALFMQDLERAERFYVDVLGYAVEWRPDPDNLYLTRGEDNLALHRQSPSARGEGRETVLDHVGLLCDTADDVRAWAKYLESKGLTLDTQPRLHRDGATSFYMRDPDGIRLQFIHHPPIAGKGRG